MINDQYTQEDHKSREDDFYALGKYRLTLKALERAKFQKKDGSLPVLLNVGCGGGLFNELAVEAGYQVVACEPDEAAYSLAKEFSHPNLKIYLGDISAIQPPVMADAIVCHDVLEHIDAENEALRMISNLLRQNGVFIVSVPAIDRLFGYHDEQLGHYRRYNKTTLKRALHFYFETKSIRYYGFFGIPAALIYSRIRNIAYPELMSSEPGLISRVMKMLIAVEVKIAFPVGTSVLAIAHKKAIKLDE
jgi:SAM-dependent methyltransferase